MNPSVLIPGWRREVLNPPPQVGGYASPSPWADRTLEVSEGSVDSLGPSAVHHEGGTQRGGATQLPTDLPQPDPAPGPAQEPRVDVGVRVIVSPLPQLQACPAWASGAGICLGGRRGGTCDSWLPCVFQTHWWHFCQKRLLEMETHTPLAYAGPPSAGV